MRVCMFTECYLPTVNGVVVSVNTFARHLERLGVEVDIVAPRCGDFRDLGDNVCRLPSLVPFGRRDYPLIIPWWPLVGRRVCARQPDLVHVHSPFIAGRLGRRAARKLKRPLVFTFHTLYEKYAHYVPLPLPLAQWLARRLSRAFAQRCDAVVAPSQGICDMLRRDGVTTRIEVIPTGIDPDLVATAPTGAMRERWGIDAAAPLLAYVGRLAKEKSIDLMLEAFALVAARMPGCVLLVVGGGDWEAEAQALAGRLGISESVRFTGCLPRPEAVRCAAEAQVLLFPSVTDTQGLVVMEAMAVGTPCIAAHSAAVTGVIEDGVNGILAAHDAAAFADAAVSLLRDRERLARLGAAAREAAQRYTAPAAAQRLLALYQSLLEQRAARAQA